MSYSPKLAEAFTFAHRVHAGQLRKDGRTPYITHPMAVAALIGEHGGTEREVVAGLLHDCVEDGDGQTTLAEIRTVFGDEVAEIVWGCSDADEHPKPPWRARKEAFIQALRDAPSSVKQVVAADKVHNARALHALLLDRGEETWSEFAGGCDGTLWYYREMLDALNTGWNSPLLDVLRGEIERLQDAAAR